jgi:hypothetical protein
MARKKPHVYLWFVTLSASGSSYRSTCGSRIRALELAGLEAVVHEAAAPARVRYETVIAGPVAFW